ncbi:MAG: CPBP family intramembrane metalloprotease [Planctomycetia bacterium]|nr:CPBP family intramembrane metalloprotease [Planctomycetia bacterium]
MIKKYPILSFFMMTMLFSWACWIPYAAAQAGLIDHVPAEVVWLGEFGPSLMALVVAGLTGFPARVREMLRKLCNGRVNPGWYLFALGVTPVLVLSSLLIDAVLFGHTVDLTLLQGWDQRFVTRTSLFQPSMGLISNLVYFMQGSTLATGLVLVILAITNGGISEELGWRGFALPGLFKQGCSPLQASLLVGFMWAVWHTGSPIWKIILTSPLSEGLQVAVTNVFEYLLLLIPLSVVYTVLMLGTGGSILLAVLLHASYNMTITLVASAWSEFPMLTLVVLLWVLAFGLTAWFKLWRVDHHMGGYKFKKHRELSSTVLAR